MEYFNLLPEEITLDIISRVPTESVLECKLVSTTWRSLIRHSSFLKMHLDHVNHPASASGKMGFIAFTYIDGKDGYHFQYFEYDENHESIERITRFHFSPPFGRDTRFLGSCNGLICYLRENTYTVCNPITREYIMIVEIKIVRMGHGACGFGYVASTNEYKVVRIMYENNATEEVYIYTLGSENGWRNIGNFNIGIGDHWDKGVFVNGALHWLDYKLGKIVSFDLAEENFREHISPPSPLEDCDDEYGYHQLGVFDGCLSFADDGNVDEAICWDVWLLEKKNDSHEIEQLEGHQSMGWSEEFRVFDNELFAVTRSYNILTYNDNHINIHDLEAATSKTIVDFTEKFDEVFPHKNTLVSLKELGEEDAKIMESVEFEETEP